MNSKKSLRLGDIYLVRKSKSKTILTARDQFGDSLDQIFADDDKIIIKKMIYPKTIDKSFSFYKLSYILNDYASANNPNNDQFENFSISANIIDDWQKKLNDAKLQNYIDKYLRYLEINERTRQIAKDYIKNKLLNSCSFDQYIDSFNQNEPGKN